MCLILVSVFKIWHMVRTPWGRLQKQWDRFSQSWNNDEILASMRPCHAS